MSPDEQEDVIASLRRKAQAGPQRLAAEIHEARQELSEGRCLTATPAESMREILKRG